jgi:hypothetical protein
MLRTRRKGIPDVNDKLEDQLRNALRTVEPGEQFTRDVMARIQSDARRHARLFPAGLRWWSAGLATSVLFSVLIVHEWHVRREQQGLDARNQLIEALRVTGEKLDLVYRVVNDPNTGPNPGA